VNRPSPSEQNVSAIKPAEKCLSDMQAFESQMEQDGYWLGGSGYRNGYPMDGLGYGYGYPIGGYPAPNATGYRDLRPGYEVRTLVASANILARHGQQQACEDVLAKTRDIYKLYVADIHSGGLPMADVPGWGQQQIAAAQPVTSTNTSFRSDELLGTDVRNPENEALGSVDDLLMSPQTGKIAYLLIARGGIFGIDEKYVPDNPEREPAHARHHQGRHGGRPAGELWPIRDPRSFRSASQKVDAHWKAHLSNKG
jgi:hypothetical protein